MKWIILTGILLVTPAYAEVSRVRQERSWDNQFHQIAS